MTNETPPSENLSRVLGTGTEDNRRDICEYLRHELTTQLNGRSDADDLVKQIVEKSEGVFLYVEHVCHDVQQGHLSLDRLDEFPQGLGGIYFQWFQRQFPDLDKFRKEVRPALRIILAARESLPLEILRSHFGYTQEELGDFLRDLGSLFQVAIEEGTKVVKAYHKSLADWLANEMKSAAYFVSIQEGNHVLAEEFVNWLHSRASDASRSVRDRGFQYWARWGLNHLALSHRQLPVDVSPFAFRQVLSNVSTSLPSMGMWTVHTAVFADEYLCFLLEGNNEAGLLQLLRLTKEAAFIEYIEAGVLEKKESSRIQIGEDFYGSTGSATDGGFIQSALKASAYAGSIARSILESRRDLSRSFAKSLIGEIGILGYLAGGFETAGWANHISRYFDDAGGFLRDELYKIIEPLDSKE